VPEDDAPETAVALIEKTLNGAAPSRDDRRRVAAFLARRGFAWDEINAALSKYADRAANPEEDLAPFDDFEEPHE
jgi:regulatory protein